MHNPIRVAVVGAGAFGRNHLRVLHDLSLQRSEPSPHSSTTKGELALQQEAVGRSGEAPVLPSVEATGASQSLDSRPAAHLVAAVDYNPQTRADITARYNIPTFATVDDLLAANLDLHAATVAVPTVAHAQVASQLLAANLDVLIEKPLTTTLAEADALVHLALAKGRILAAGHLERFNPSVTAALQRLTRPMFYEAHRLSIFTPRSLDVDVVLDLMIHDLDILLTMDTSGVIEVRAVGLPVLSHKVDIANVRLEFGSGAVANLTASRISTEQVRKLRLFQPAQYLSLDYARQELLTINVEPTLAAATLSSEASSRLGAVGRNGETPVHPATQPQEAAPQHPSRGLSFDKLDLPRAEPLRLELEDFLTAVGNRTEPRVTAVAARRALALALDINDAMAAHTQRAGL